MVGATIAVVDRGGLECDLNYQIEGNTLDSPDTPNPDTEYVKIPVLNFVIDHPEGTILWDTGSHHDAANSHWFRSLKLLEELERRHNAEIVYDHDPEQFAEIKDGWGR